MALQLTGDPVGGERRAGRSRWRRTSRSTARATSSASTRRAIFRTDPRAWITNYESNYLAAIDFYDEDFPWRYTPAAPDGPGCKLRPWIALIVLQESEFNEGRTTRRPAAVHYDHRDDTKLLPPADELWAWAHVHFNQSVAGHRRELVSPDMSAVLPRVQTIIAQNPDLAYARIVVPAAAGRQHRLPCLRRSDLRDRPARRARPRSDAAPFATASAWARLCRASRNQATMPIYYRWYFRTGDKGDFEYLVTLLKPQPVDPQVGTRDMDVQDPGSNIPGITTPSLGGVLRLGGALQVPDADLTADATGRSGRNTRTGISLIRIRSRKRSRHSSICRMTMPTNRASGQHGDGDRPGISDDPDPLITSPLYGRWHALTQRLLTNRDGTPAPNDTNWVHRLNLDPRFRVAAALAPTWSRPTPKST